jgi:hypothetical protein
MAGIPSIANINRFIESGLGRSLDPDAKGYINSVVAAGGTVSGTQRAAINTFYKTGKADGWYSSLKRVYLPIWGVAAPNAIDMIARGSGTFTGTVTHGAGYVQSNGTTGYFRTGTAFSTEGLSAADGYIFGLHYTANTTNPAVCIGSGNTNTCYYFMTTTTATARWCNSASGSSIATTRTGIFSFSRKSGVRTFWRRATSGRTVLVTSTDADAGTISASPVLAMANNGTDVAATFNPQFYDDGQKGAYGFGLGLTNAQDLSFTASLKTLWETCTGLTLP